MTAATFVVYGGSLRLLFFYDDLQHLVWLRDQTPISVFFGNAGRTYYRPMQFLSWKLYETFFGGDSALAYHALNLGLHALNALLVVGLARRLTDRKDRWWPASLAGLIFVLFPFAYQVVPLPASLTHPLATFFVLSAVLAYDRFQARGKFRWLVAALGCSLFAFLSNESSILVAGLIAVFVVTQPSPERRWRWIGAFVLLAAIYYLWYQGQQANNSGNVHIRNLGTLFQNGVYMLEGLSFPLLPFGDALMNWGLGDQAAVVIMTLISLAIPAALLLRVGRFRLFVFGVGWYGFCVAPAIALLSNNYLINAPRLMYLGSVGAAILWASAIEAIWDLIRLRWVRRIVTVTVAIGVLLPAGVFVRQRMDLYTLTAAPLQAVVDAAEQAQPAKRLLFVNLPAWLGPATGWYPIGHEGVLFLQKSISMDDLLIANLGRARPTAAVEFDSLATPQAYFYGIYGPKLDWEPLKAQVRAADQVYLTLYKPQAIDLLKAGGLLKSAQPSSSPVATFGEALVLENAAWSVCNDHLNVTLDWRAQQAAPENLHAFVHVLNPDGTLAAQHDSPPLLGLYPFWQWSQGDRAEDIHPIDISSLPRDQTFTLAVGLYDPSNGQRTTPTLANGEQPPDNAIRIGQFTIGGAAPCRPLNND